MLKEILALTDDLTQSQFQELIYWLWKNKYKVSIAAIIEWRKFKNMEVKY